MIPSVALVRVGDALKLQRRQVTVDPLSMYGEIGVRSFGRGIFHKEPVAGADFGTKRVFRVEPGDLVLSNVFAWEGAIAVASEKERGLIGSHRFMTYRPSSEEVSTNYVRYFLLSDRGLELIRRASPGSAGRNRTLGINAFESMEIPLPLIGEQRRIAAAIDGLRGKHQSTNGAVRDVPTELYLASLPGLVDAALTSISDGKVSVGDLADIVSYIVHPGDDPSPATHFVGLQHVEGHSGRRIGQSDLGDETGRKFRFQPGDVIYGYLRPYLNKVWVADQHGLCSVDQYVLRPRAGVSSALLGHLLRSRSLLDAAIDATHSLQLPRLRSALLLAIDVPIVRQESVSGVVHRLNRLAADVMAVADARRRQVELLQALERSIVNGPFAAIAS